LAIFHSYVKLPEGNHIFLGGSATLGCHGQDERMNEAVYHPSPMGTLPMAFHGKRIWMYAIVMNQWTLIHQNASCVNHNWWA
jgi:hypothetical protein